MKLIFFCALFCFTAIARAADSNSPEIDKVSAENLFKSVEVLTSPRTEGRAPMTPGSKVAKDFIIRQMRENGIFPAGEALAGEGGYIQPVKSRLTYRTIGRNIVGWIPGEKVPEECIYVDAHYDHWGKAEGNIQPGADDNASGVAVMLELGRVISQMRLDRSVVFLASDYEEGALFPDFGGLKGADHQVRNSFCVPEMIKGGIVMDMVGGEFVPGAHETLFLFGSESSPELYGLVKELSLSPDAAVPVRQLGIYSVEFLGSLVPLADYDAFRSAHIPWVFATSGAHKEYHTPRDTIETLHFDFMKNEGSEILKLIARMASKDFNASYAADDEKVVDWDHEIDTAVQTLGSVARVPDMFGLMARARQDELLALKAERPRKIEAIRDALKNTSGLLMSAAGNESTTLSKLLYRKH